MGKAVVRTRPIRHAFSSTADLGVQDRRPGMAGPLNQWRSRARSERTDDPGLVGHQLVEGNRWLTRRLPTVLWSGARSKPVHLGVERFDRRLLGSGSGCGCGRVDGFERFFTSVANCSSPQTASLTPVFAASSARSAMPNGSNRLGSNGRWLRGVRIAMAISPTSVARQKARRCHITCDVPEPHRPRVVVLSSGPFFDSSCDIARPIAALRCVEMWAPYLVTRCGAQVPRWMTGWPHTRSVRCSVLYACRSAELPTTPTPAARWLGDTHLYSEDAADLDEAVMLIGARTRSGRPRTRRPVRSGGFFGLHRTAGPTAHDHAEIALTQRGSDGFDIVSRMVATAKPGLRRR